MMWWLIIIAVLLVLAIAIWAYFGTVYVKTTHIDIVNKRIPKQFNGKKIVHLSDLQNCKYKNFYDRILQLVQSENPDYILFSGDLIDRRKYNLENAREFVQIISKVAPIYFVTGNHEAWCGHYDDVKSMLLNFGVTILDDKSVFLTVNSEKIRIAGIDDPGFSEASYAKTNIADVSAVLETLKDTSCYSVLLTHRPELLQTYAEYDFDLVLCGHAHGGQFRLPLIGALFAPHQGIFPKYVDGIHIEKNTTEIINRGLGSGKFQFRTFNRPEIIAITLKNQ